MKCSLVFFCKCTWVKSSCKNIITTKEALLRFTIFSFFGSNSSSQCKGNFYDTIVVRKTFSFANCEHKQCSHCWCSCVETLVMLPAKFHLVSRLLTVLKIEILMLSWENVRLLDKMSSGFPSDVLRLSAINRVSWNQPVTSDSCKYSYELARLAECCNLHVRFFFSFTRIINHWRCVWCTDGKRYALLSSYYKSLYHQSDFEGKTVT